MSMGSSIQTVENRNLASPLSEDYIKVLQGQIDEGAFGTGVGPMQRSAGKSAQQYVRGLEERVGAGVNTESKVQDYSSRLIDAERTLANRQTDREAANLREAFGAAGTRYGTTLLQGEGRFREDRAQGLDATIAQILTQQGDREQAAREFDITSGQNQMQMLLQGIASLFNMGEANTAEFSKFASQGIVNPDNIVTPGLGSQLLSGGLNFLSSYLSGGGKIPNPFGGRGGDSYSNVNPGSNIIDPRIYTSPNPYGYGGTTFGRPV